MTLLETLMLVDLPDATAYVTPADWVRMVVDLGTSPEVLRQKRQCLFVQTPYGHVKVLPVGAGRI